ncbi:hypothetical protein D3C76_619260 [compost metagenome]
MDWAVAANVASLIAGSLSAAFWIKAAVVKAPPPPDLEGKPDGDYWKGTIVNGGDLLGTLRLQAKWNSLAAWAASAAVALQIAYNLIN